MYRIGILEKDKDYLDRLVDFLDRHHRGSFEINVAEADEADWENLSLEPLDMETVQYDALFFGDGVDTQERIPADVAVGYLTEYETGEKPEWIGKYQSMEQIYRQMLYLCEDGRTRPESGGAGRYFDAPFMEYDAVQEVRDAAENGRTYRVWRVDDKKIDRIAVRMLAGNKIKGLQQLACKDGELWFDTTGMKSLYQYVREHDNPEGKQELLKFFDGMIRTALFLEEYTLSADRLMLDPAEIYVDEAKGEAAVPYIPLKGGERKGIGGLLCEIGRLCALLLADADREDNAGWEHTFDATQEEAGESQEPRREAQAPAREEEVPFLIRKKTGEKIPVHSSLFRLGKDASHVDYCITDNPTVSRNHADIMKKQDGYYLADKGSLNHTFVDGRKLGAEEIRRLENGCLVQLADEVFQFVLRKTDRE